MAEDEPLPHCRLVLGQQRHRFWLVSTVHILLLLQLRQIRRMTLASPSTSQGRVLHGLPQNLSCIDSTGQEPCDQCANTFAKWYCEAENKKLCSRCNLNLHPLRNPQLTCHKRYRYEPKMGQVGMTIPLSTYIKVCSTSLCPPHVALMVALCRTIACCTTRSPWSHTRAPKPTRTPDFMGMPW